MRAMLIVVMVAAAACGKMPTRDTCDMSTDDKALAVYNKVTSQHRTDKTECFDHRAAFPQYLVVGTHVPNTGCRDEVKIWHCAKVDTTPVEDILVAAGWKTAKPLKKHELIDEWVRPLKTAHPLFEKAGKAFDPPTYDDGADGSVTITYWMVANSEDEGGTVELERRNQKFNADGTVKPHNILDHLRD